MSGVLSMWTVYDKPFDWPDHYVARRWEIERGGPRPTDDIITSTDIDLIRKSLSMRGLTPLARSDGDEPHIVETWL